MAWHVSSMLTSTSGFTSTALCGLPKCTKCRCVCVDSLVGGLSICCQKNSFANNNCDIFMTTLERSNLKV